MALPSFTSIPGQAVPGRFTIASPGSGSSGSGFWLYSGNTPEYYLDYLNAPLGETLYAVPGGTYSIVVANTRQGLTIPPQGPAWNANLMEAVLSEEIVLPEERKPDPAVVRARNAATAHAIAHMARLREVVTRSRGGT